MKHVNHLLDHVDSAAAREVCPQCWANRVAPDNEVPGVVWAAPPDALLPFLLALQRRAIGPLETSTAVVPFKFHGVVDSISLSADNPSECLLTLRVHDLGVADLLACVMEQGEPVEVLVSPAPTEALGA